MDPEISQNVTERPPEISLFALPELKKSGTRKEVSPTPPRRFFTETSILHFVFEELKNGRVCAMVMSTRE